MNRQSIRPYLMIGALATMVALPGCKEMEEVFANQEEGGPGSQAEHSLGGPKKPPPPPPPPPESAAFQAARAELENRKLEVEPKERDKAIIWNVKRRVSCSDAGCIEQTRKRLESFGDISKDLEALLASTSNTSVQVETIRLIGLLGYSQLASSVGPLLRAQTQRVRLAACQTLGWLSAPSSASALLARLDAADDRSERTCLIQSLKKMPGAEVVDCLSALASGRNTDEALAAVAALKPRTEAVESSLERAVALSESFVVKRAALEALASRDTKAAQKALRSATRSRDSQVKAVARELMKKKK